MHFTKKYSKLFFTCNFVCNFFNYTFDISLHKERNYEYIFLICEIYPKKIHSLFSYYDTDKSIFRKLQMEIYNSVNVNTKNYITIVIR